MRGRLAAGGLAVGLAMSSPAQAEPRASCSARVASSRVLVDPALEDTFDEQQLTLIRLGLVGRIHLEASLLRHRFLWLDDRLDAQSVDLSVSWTAESGYLVEGRPAADLRELAIERLALHRGGDGEVPGGLSVEIHARLQVVTPKSLGRVAGWMVEGERSRATRTLLEVLADDLTRSASGRCEVVR